MNTDGNGGNDGDDNSIKVSSKNSSKEIMITVISIMLKPKAGM